jgi:hypothetical protein
MDTGKRIYKYSDFEEEEEDACCECSEIRVQECCNKCGSGVCLRVSCCQVFPHYNKNMYIICNTCVSNVEKKLRPVSSIDHHDLRLLKTKISKRINKKTEELKGQDTSLKTGKRQ